MHDTAIYLRKRIIGSIEKEPPRPHNPEVVGSNPAPATKTFSSSEALFLWAVFFFDFQSWSNFGRNQLKRAYFEQGDFLSSF